MTISVLLDESSARHLRPIQIKDFTSKTMGNLRRCDVEFRTGGVGFGVQSLGGSVT